MKGHWEETDRFIGDKQLNCRSANLLERNGKRQLGRDLPGLE